MASIDEALVTLVINAPALQAVLGSAPMRFYPDVKPQGAALPAATYQRISTPAVQNQKAKPTLFHPRFQLTLFTRSAADRSAVKQAFRAVLEGYSDRASGGIIDRIIVAGERDDYESAVSNYNATMDLTIWHVKS